MSAETAAVARAQPLQGWRPERYEPLLPAGEPAGAGGALASLPRAGRTLDIALATLMSGVIGADAATVAPAGGDLQQRATLAARNGYALAAVVLEALPEGRYQVAIGDARLVLSLAADLEAGEPVLLRPLPGPVTDAPAPAPQAGPSIETDLGSTAQMLSRLAASGPSDRTHAAPIRTTAPLAGTPADTRQLAAGLEDAIRSSGLFYESHLADWVDGATSKAALQREPQASLTPAAAADAGSRLGAQAEGLVQRQLDMLEHRTALWQGQAWPGQPAEIRVAEDDAANPAYPGARSWQATLKVAMPGLGEVEARISLTGSTARLQLDTGSPGGAQALAAARGDFARALAAEGLTLADVRIDHGTVAGPR